MARKHAFTTIIAAVLCSIVLHVCHIEHADITAHHQDHNTRAIDLLLNISRQVTVAVDEPQDGPLCPQCYEEAACEGASIWEALSNEKSKLPQSSFISNGNGLLKAHGWVRVVQHQILMTWRPKVDDVIAAMGLKVITGERSQTDFGGWDPTCWSIDFEDSVISTPTTVPLSE
jgi:hypothetical protein